MDVALRALLAYVTPPLENADKVQLSKNAAAEQTAPLAEEEILAEGNRPIADYGNAC